MKSEETKKNGPEKKKSRKEIEQAHAMEIKMDQPISQGTPCK